MRLKGNIAVITGARSGIGAAIAKRYHEEGATVVLADRSGAEQDVAEQLGERAVGIHADVTEEDDLRALIEQTVGRFGTDGGCDVHRMNDIGEENRDLFVLGTGIAVLDWCATAVTKPGILEGLSATRPACCYGRHPTLRQSGPPVLPG